MPRDLQAMAKKDETDDDSSARKDQPVAKESNIPSTPQLTKSPEEVDGEAPNSHDLGTSMSANDEHRMMGQMVQSRSKRDELHPYVQTLTISDVESCTALEAEAFPPHERCTREKFTYRLHKANNLSLGLFTSSTSPTIPTASTSKPVYTGAPARKAVLIALICATKTTNPVVKDTDMLIPNPDPFPPQHREEKDKEEVEVGHQELGRTLCIHSLAVLPQFQRRGLGRTLLMAYLQRLETQPEVADRVALIAHQELVPYYEGFGFVNKGKSECGFGGGGWFDCVRDVAGESES